MRHSLVAISICFYSVISHAATLTVDCDSGGKIMEALSKARPGDTVLTSGTCNEHVNIAPEQVRITLDGQKKTTLKHPGGEQTSPHALYNRGKEITIKNFTVTGGLDGIHLSGPASAVLDGNVVVDNKGRGIHIDKGSIAMLPLSMWMPRPLLSTTTLPSSTADAGPERWMPSSPPVTVKFLMVISLPRL